MSISPFQTSDGVVGTNRGFSASPMSLTNRNRICDRCMSKQIKLSHLRSRLHGMAMEQKAFLKELTNLFTGSSHLPVRPLGYSLEGARRMYQFSALINISATR